MTAFAVGQPQSTEVPRIAVDAGLKPGLHRFRLVVVDSAGLSSKPDEVMVQVTNPTAPTGPVVPVVPVTPVIHATPVAPSPPIGRTPRRTPRTPR